MVHRLPEINVTHILYKTTSHYNSVHGEAIEIHGLHAGDTAYFGMQAWSLAGNWREMREAGKNSSDVITQSSKFESF